MGQISPPLSPKPITMSSPGPIHLSMPVYRVTIVEDGAPCYSIGQIELNYLAAKIAPGWNGHLKPINGTLGGRKL